MALPPPPTGGVYLAVDTWPLRLPIRLPLFFAVCGPIALDLFACSNCSPDETPIANCGYVCAIIFRFLELCAAGTDMRFDSCQVPSLTAVSSLRSSFEMCDSEREFECICIFASLKFFIFFLLLIWLRAELEPRYFSL